MGYCCCGSGGVSLTFSWMHCDYRLLAVYLLQSCQNVIQIIHYINVFTVQTYEAVSVDFLGTSSFLRYCWFLYIAFILDSDVLLVLTNLKSYFVSYNCRAVVTKPRVLAHMIRNKFGSADNISSMRKLHFCYFFKVFAYRSVLSLAFCYFL